MLLCSLNLQCRKHFFSGNTLYIFKHNLNYVFLYKWKIILNLTLHKLLNAIQTFLVWWSSNTQLHIDPGKVTRTLKVSSVKRFKSRTPITGTKSQAEKKNKEYGGKKKKNLLKLLDYHQKLIKDKGLPSSKLMPKHAAEATTTLHPVQMPGQKNVSSVQCDQCENKLNSQQKLRKHYMSIVS